MFNCHFPGDWIKYWNVLKLNTRKNDWKNPEGRPRDRETWDLLIYILDVLGEGLILTFLNIFCSRDLHYIQIRLSILLILWYYMILLDCWWELLAILHRSCDTTSFDTRAFHHFEILLAYSDIKCSGHCKMWETIFSIQALISCGMQVSKNTRLMSDVGRNRIRSLLIDCYNLGFVSRTSV